jgi:hypothetical protein
MADRIRKIISPDGLKRAKNELAYLFRLIAYEIGLHGGLWENNLRKYLDRTEHGVPKNNKDRSYARGNLNTQLMDDRMTWNVFMQGLKFLGATKIKFKVELTWPSGRTTTHSMNVRANVPEEQLSIAEIELGIPPNVAKIGVPAEDEAAQVALDRLDPQLREKVHAKLEEVEKIIDSTKKASIRERVSAKLDDIMDSIKQAPESIRAAYPPKKAVRDMQRLTDAIDELNRVGLVPEDVQ